MAVTQNYGAMKELFTIEYGLKKGSKKVLWNFISTPNGLSEWLAERVEASGDLFTFHWGKSFDQATLVSSTPLERVRFHWLHDADSYYFEIAISDSELTGEHALTITDFAEPEEKEDMIQLWGSEVEKLIRRVGM